MVLFFSLGIFSSKAASENPAEERIEEDFKVVDFEEDRVIVEGIEEKVTYVVDKEYFPEDVKKEDVFTIVHNGIVLMSYPGQFGKIYEVVPKDGTKTNGPILIGILVVAGLGLFLGNKYRKNKGKQA